MDVRCENCQTVYEFDDARVKETGVTVKCTQCGHIFKVRKREAQRPAKRTLPGVPINAEAAPAPAPRAPAAPIAATPVVPVIPVAGGTGAAGGDFSMDSLPPGSESRVWMLRSNSTGGEIRRFRELTTLQQWIVEKKAFRDDEISRTGDRWKKLSGIAELNPFFRIVDQAEARARSGPIVTTHSPSQVAPLPAERHLQSAYTLTASHPVAQPISDAGDANRAAPGASAMPSMRSANAALPGPAALSGNSNTSGSGYVPPSIPSDFDDEPVLPRRSFRGAMLVAVSVMLFVVGILGYLFAFKRPDLKSLVSGDEGGRGQEAYRRGREYFLLDTDDDFRHAEQQLQRAQGADEQNPLPVAALASVNATWARYLFDDARAQEQAQPAHAQDLRRTAQARVDDAKRYANEARSLAPDDADVNIAMADFLVTEGAPAAQVEDALRRAEAKRADDPAVAYLRGILLAREKKMDDARTLLNKANQLNQRVTQHDLLRADYSLATMALDAGRRDEARAAAQRILDANNRHDRARALFVRIEAAPIVPAPAAVEVDAGAPSAVAPAVAAEPPPAAPPVAAAAPAVDPGAPPAGATNPPPSAPAAAAAARAPSAGGAAPSEPSAPAAPRSYEALVAAGNHLLENGKGKKSVESFEKALAERPDGVDAEIGLGYAYLDTEHYNAAIEMFRKVLTSTPGNGEAVIGLAETYKMRGDKPHALEFYKRYVAEHAGGSKSSMAQHNVAELEQEIAHSAPARPATATEIRELPAPPPGSTPPNP